MATPTEVVLALIDAFNRMDIDAIVASFTDDAVYHNMPLAPVEGTEGIRKTVQGFMAAASEVQWDIVNIVEQNGTVLTERVDKFLVNDTWIDLPVMGTFEVHDGRITAWRDYFDLNQFQTQMAAATG